MNFNVLLGRRIEVFNTQPPLLCSGVRAAKTCKRRAFGISGLHAKRVTTGKNESVNIRIRVVNFCRSDNSQYSHRRQYNTYEMGYENGER